MNGWAQALKLLSLTVCRYQQHHDGTFDMLVHANKLSTYSTRSFCSATSFFETATLLQRIQRTKHEAEECQATHVKCRRHLAHEIRKFG